MLRVDEEAVDPPRRGPKSFSFNSVMALVLSRKLKAGLLSLSLSLFFFLSLLSFFGGTFFIVLYTIS